MTSASPERLRVLVVDDERPARQRIVDLLRAEPDIASVLERQNGAEAVEAIRAERPDLVFLDVQMPELDGLAVVDTVGAAAMPFTVFVTAFDRHAIRAFEANALDYLLKPFSDQRFGAALARARTRLDDRQLRDFGQRLLRVAVAAPRAAARLDRLVVKTAGTTRFVKLADIDWIEAAGVYVNLHVGPKELLYRGTIAELADRVDPARFVRVHRSAILNIESVLQLEPVSHGEFEAVLKSGARVRISRTYRAGLEARLGQPL